MADFEITLAFHKIKTIGKREIISVGYDADVVTSESGLLFKPNVTIKGAMNLADVEGLIIPGGPIQNQKQKLTEFIQLLDKRGKMLAAICNGPQFLGRAGILDVHKFTTSCSEEKIKSLGVKDPFPRKNYIDKRVVRDEHIITAKGRAFVDFSFEIFDYLKIYEKEEEKLQLLKDIKQS